MVAEGLKGVGEERGDGGITKGELELKFFDK